MHAPAESYCATFHRYQSLRQKTSSSLMSTTSLVSRRCGRWRKAAICHENIIKMETRTIGNAG